MCITPVRSKAWAFEPPPLASARRHSVTGWVRNEPDGGVLLEIQGDELAIREALTEIRHSMGHNIRSEQSTPIADTGQELGFEIMH